MELTNTQKQLIEEMIQQGGEKSTINGIMSRLKTEKKQQMMLDYLIQTREISVPVGNIILKSIEIKRMKD